MQTRSGPWKRIGSPAERKTRTRDIYAYQKLFGLCARTNASRIPHLIPAQFRAICIQLAAVRRTGQGEKDKAFELCVVYVKVG